MNNKTVLVLEYQDAGQNNRQLDKIYAFSSGVLTKFYNKHGLNKTIRFLNKYYKVVQVAPNWTTNNNILEFIIAQKREDVCNDC